MKKTLVALFIFALLAFSGTDARAETDAVYQRVLKAQTIRCGYAEWPPFFKVDPNTKKMSGLTYDVWESLGKQLNLKIEWAQSVGWGDITEAVKTGKIDAFCVGVWPDSGRMKNMLLSRPVFYNAMYLFGRADETRFDNNYAAIDDPSVTVGGQEGDVTSFWLEFKFPKAKTSHTPLSAQQVDLFLNVISKKTDVTVSDLAFARDYMAQNPGKVKQIKGPPLVMFPTVVPLATGESQMKNMIDTALGFMINDGTMAGLIKKNAAVETYAPEPDVKMPDAPK